MSFGGLGGRSAWEAMQPKRVKCERCGLYYRQSLDRCRWCGDLDENGLARLLVRKERSHQSNKWIGQMFFVMAIIIGMLLVLS